MTEKTHLAKTILAAGDNPHLDRSAVNILRHKCILAQIVHEALPEFRNMDVKEIEDHIGTPEVRKHPIDDNLKEDVADTTEDLVAMKDTASKSINDGSSFLTFILTHSLKVKRKQFALLLTWRSKMWLIQDIRSSFVLCTMQHAPL